LFACEKAADALYFQMAEQNLLPFAQQSPIHLYRVTVRRVCSPHPMLLVGAINARLPNDIAAAKRLAEEYWTPTRTDWAFWEYLCHSATVEELIGQPDPMSVYTAQFSAAGDRERITKFLHS